MKYKGIIVSGLPCSGKSVLCEKLAQEYGWNIFSFGKMWRDKWRLAYPNGNISFEDWWRNTTIEDNKQMNTVGKELFKRGDFIIDSRYSAFYCKDLPYLRVFLNADLDTRVKRCKEREDRNVTEGVLAKGRSEEELRKIVQEREQDEYKMGQEIFSEDYRKLSHYNLMLNTGEFTIMQEFNCLRALLETTR